MTAERVSGQGGPRGFRAVALIWLGWAVLLLGFQAFAVARFDLARPDNTLDWTASGTEASGDPGLMGPLNRYLKAHAAWDSEYYLSIALNGYDDPAMRAAAPDSTPDTPDVELKGDEPSWTSLSYAFLPGYPFTVRVVSWPLRLLPVTPLTAAALAGVAVSLAGTLAAMLAIYDLARRRGGEDQGLRSAFYLGIWPASVFLGQVYSEGLFLGLSFGALALMRRERWAWAAALAAAAVWTRATGVLLFVPFAWVWLGALGPPWRMRRPTRMELLRLGFVLAPALAYLAWRLVLGAPFEFVDSHYFGRGILALGGSRDALEDAVTALLSGSSQSRAYYLVEFAATAIGVAASAWLWRSDKALALYGLAIIGVALTSGSILGMPRYVLGVPALFLVPGALGRNNVFDRLWTLGGCLGLAVLSVIFSFGFWVG